MAAPRTLRLIDSQPAADLPGPVSVEVVESSPGTKLEGGASETQLEDGSVEINFNPDQTAPLEEKPDNFYRNLASEIDEGKLAEIASNLLDGIEKDEESRKEWLATRARGISLLGLKLEEPRGDLGATSAPLEGMSSIRHPLLLEATIRFQANARGELLPSTGPVKIRNDRTTPPKPPPAPNPATMAGAGGAAPVPPTPAAPPTESGDDLAQALEVDFNHYLTSVATEYVPDTDRMLFYIGFGGDGFKKVYNCPLRRRVVSESVDAEDLIVSNAATDLKNCGRVTHKIAMRRSILRRMQIVKAYRDIPLVLPNQEENNAVDEKKADIDGIKPVSERAEDRDYTIYETYCEIELDSFAPSHMKNKALPLPYRVTIEKDSRQILSIVRNWNADDKQCLTKQFFVQFPFIRGLGFYGLGFIHVLGNTTSALTAMWREMVDAGMFSNFPGFIYAKVVGRQLTNQFRVPPGGGIPIDLPASGASIRDMVMPLPYKEVGPSFTAFVKDVEGTGRQLGQTAELNIGEGKQDAPVGTTLALIEQATKLLDSVHKRLHWAQSEEFALLKERFREDPEAFWRHNKRPTVAWKKEQFLKALEDHELVPVADPNNPTSLHRMAKAAAVEGLASKYPQLIDTKAALERVFRISNIDTEGLFRDQPLPPPPDPRMIAIQQKAQTSSQQQQVQAQDSMMKAQLALAQLADKAKDRESRERIEQMKIVLEGVKLQEEKVIHQHEIIGDHIKNAAEIEADRARTQQELQAQAAQGQQEMYLGGTAHALDLAKDHHAHIQRMEHDRQLHEMKKEHAAELHAQKLEHARALAEIQKKDNNKKD